jgi:hypothetical protein
MPNIIFGFRQFIFSEIERAMAHWYHRNPLKATAVANFELKLTTAETHAIQLCSELRSARTALIEMLPNPNHSGPAIEKALKNYVELLMGFIETPRDDCSIGGLLRWSLRFSWTHSMLGTTAE